MKYFLGSIVLLLLASCGNQISDYKESLDVMKSKEWKFEKDPQNHSFLDSVTLKFINDSIFALKLDSKVCGTVIAQGRYSIERLKLKEDYAESEKLREKLKAKIESGEGALLRMETKILTTNGNKNSNFINESGELNADPSYNIIEGYFYSNRSGTYKDIIVETDKDKKIVAIHLPKIYTAYQSYTKSSYEWSVITLK